MVIDDLSPLAEFWDGTTLELLDQYGKDRADMGGDSEMRGFYSSLLQVRVARAFVGKSSWQCYLLLRSFFLRLDLFACSPSSRSTSFLSHSPPPSSLVAQRAAQPALGGRLHHLSHHHGPRRLASTGHSRRGRSPS